MISLNTLVCHQHVDMAVFSFRRLGEAWTAAWRLEIFDDGSLTPEDWDRLRGEFPDAGLHPRDLTAKRVEPMLAKYPYSLDYYRTQAFGTKLLAVPLLANGTMHYCDSDIIFLRPTAGWLPDNDLPVGLNETSVLLSHTLKQWWQQLGVPLATRFNSGLMRTPADVADLDKIEWFLARCRQVRYHTLVEQTCWAFLLAGRPHLRLAGSTIHNDLRRLPTETEPTAIHFLGELKASFQTYAAQPLNPDPAPAPRYLPGRTSRLPYVLGREARRLWARGLQRG